MTDHNYQAAYQRGRADRRAGASEHANPYPWTTDTRAWLHEGWLSGWRDADRMLRDLGA